MKNKNNLIYAFIIGALLSAVFIVLSTIVGGLFHPFKEWLKAVFYHHWIGKGILSLALFFIGAIIFFPFTKNIDDAKTNANILILFWTILFGVSAIFMFYIYEIFAHM